MIAAFSFLYSGLFLGLLSQDVIAIFWFDKERAFDFADRLIAGKAVRGPADSTLLLHLRIRRRN